MATVKGVWIFNETIDVSTDAIEELYEVVVNYTSYHALMDTENYEYDSLYLAADLGVNYGLKNQVYGIFDGWVDERCRTIDLGATEQEVSDEFYTWFTANAVQQSVEEDTSGATVTYDSVTMADLSAGQTATLSCASKKAVADIVIAFSTAGSIMYNGVTTEVEAGKIATLTCNGKKMLTDVVVAVSSEEVAEYTITVYDADGIPVDVENTIKAGETVTLSMYAYGVAIDSYTGANVVCESYTADDSGFVGYGTFVITVSNPTDDVVIRLSTTKNAPDLVPEE